MRLARRTAAFVMFLSPTEILAVAEHRLITHTMSLGHSSSRLAIRGRNVLEALATFDPDFAHLTYGDRGSRGTRIRDTLSAGDFIAFWAGLRELPTNRRICSIIGF